MILSYPRVYTFGILFNSHLSGICGGVLGLTLPPAWCCDSDGSTLEAATCVNKRNTIRRISEDSSASIWSSSVLSELFWMKSLVPSKSYRFEISTHSLCRYEDNKEQKIKRQRLNDLPISGNPIISGKTVMWRKQSIDIRVI